MIIAEMLVKQPKQFLRMLTWVLGVGTVSGTASQSSPVCFVSCKSSSANMDFKTENFGLYGDIAKASIRTHSDRKGAHGHV